MLVVYDGDEPEDEERNSGFELVVPGFFDFDASGLTPGSYSLVVQHDGVFKAIHPVVVSGYQLTVNAPSEARDQFQVTVQVIPEAANGTPHDVRIAVVNKTAETSVLAAPIGGEKYRATVRTESLAPGQYRVYAVAQGEQTVFGRQELLGVSDTIDLTISRSTVTSVATTATRAETENAEPTG